MVCPLRFVLVAASAVIAIIALWQVNGPDQRARQHATVTNLQRKVPFNIVFEQMQSHLPLQMTLRMLSFVQDRKGFWGTALSWFTGEYVLDAIRRWQAVDLVGKGKL